jgi:hypothetical protein
MDMRNKILILSLIAVLSIGLLLVMESGRFESDSQTLRMQHTCDSLMHINRGQEIRILELEQEVESLQDALSDCTEDFQNCLAGRKIQIRYQNGNILTSNPEY